MPDQPVAQGDPKPGKVIRTALAHLPYHATSEFMEPALVALDALLARAEAAEAKLNAIGLLLDVDAEHTGWDRIRELKGQLAQAREALREVRVYAVRLDELFSKAPLGGQLPSLIMEVIDSLSRLEQGDKDAS